MDHDADAAAEGVRLLHRVRRQDHGAGLGDAGDEGPHVAAGLWVHARGRLVEEGDPRVRHHAHRHRQLALVPARVRLAHRARLLGEGHVRDGALDDAGDQAGRHAADLCEHGEVLAGRQVVDERIKLGAEADEGAAGLQVPRDGPAVDEAVARVARLDAGQHAHHGALAGPVGPQQAVHGALLHLERHPPARPRGRRVARAVCLGQAGGDDGRRLLLARGVALDGGQPPRQGRLLRPQPFLVLGRERGGAEGAGEQLAEQARVEEPEQRGEIRNVYCEHEQALRELLVPVEDVCGGEGRAVEGGGLEDAVAAVEGPARDERQGQLGGLLLGRGDKHHDDPGDEDGEVDYLVRHHLRRLFLVEEEGQAVPEQDDGRREEQVQQRVAQEVVVHDPVHPPKSAQNDEGCAESDAVEQKVAQAVGEPEGEAREAREQEHLLHPGHAEADHVHGVEYGQHVEGGAHKERQPARADGVGVERRLPDKVAAPNALGECARVSEVGGGVERLRDQQAGAGHCLLVVSKRDRARAVEGVHLEEDRHGGGGVARRGREHRQVERRRVLEPRGAALEAGPEQRQRLRDDGV